MTRYGDYPDLSGIGRILIVKLRNHGDVLLSSPLFTALKTAIPQARIDAYIYRDTLPMLEGHPAISAFRFYERDWKRLGLAQRLQREIALLREIRSAGYDMVINLNDGDRGAWAAWLSGARYRVGWMSSRNQQRFRARLYTHIVKSPPRPRHAVDLSLDCARRIGIFPAPGQAPLNLYVPPEASTRVSALLTEGGISPGAFVLVHPTSRWLFKSWTIEKFAALMDQIAQSGLAVVVSAAPDAREQEAVAAMVAACQTAKPLSLAGQLTLKELAALIGASRALVCVDSVPLHIASALKKPTVVLFGPSSEQEWGPWENPRAEAVTENYSCRPCGLDGCGGSKVSDCLTTLPIDKVFSALERVLGK